MVLIFHIKDINGFAKVENIGDGLNEIWPRQKNNFMLSIQYLELKVVKDRFIAMKILLKSLGENSS